MLRLSADRSAAIASAVDQQDIPVDARPRTELPRMYRVTPLDRVRWFLEDLSCHPLVVWVRVNILRERFDQERAVIQELGRPLGAELTNGSFDETLEIALPLVLAELEPHWWVEVDDQVAGRVRARGDRVYWRLLFSESDQLESVVARAIHGAVWRCRGPFSERPRLRRMRAYVSDLLLAAAERDGFEGLKALASS